MRTCPFRGCDRLIPNDRFCCSLHFARLTFNEQTAIFNAYDRHRRGEISSMTLLECQRRMVNAVQGRNANA
jgi:hypothetical protein